MALIKCSECGKEISNKANACPNCGCPVEKETRIVNITRKGGAPALKAYITIDGQDIGNIRANKNISTDLTIGKHTINVKTVGVRGEDTSVDGIQIDITSDMEQINISVGNKYSLMNEITDRGQEIMILEVDYGNGKIIKPLEKEKPDIVKRKNNRKQIPLLIIGVLCFDIGLILGPTTTNDSLKFISVILIVIGFVCYGIGIRNMIKNNKK